MIGKTIQETFEAVRTPAELAMWLRKWTAQGVELWDDDVLKLADAIERVSPGNAAALREALDKALCVCLAAAMFKERGMPDDALCADFDGAIEACKSALSAPARNCDRFQNASVAAIAYRAENEISDEADFFASLANWLFAPAEGGKE